MVAEKRHGRGGEKKMNRKNKVEKKRADKKTWKKRGGRKKMHLKLNINNIFSLIYYIFCTKVKGYLFTSL